MKLPFFVALFSVTLLLGAASSSSSSGYRPRKAPHSVRYCYDCNYNPYGSYHHGVQENAGTSACALQGEEERRRVHAEPCLSGTCYIRLDGNGLVYRGCADAANLNLNVEKTRQCSVQEGSIYVFCLGSLCNQGDIFRLCYRPFLYFPLSNDNSV